jgi:outer membrane protein assembly factor BamA
LRLGARPIENVEVAWQERLEVVSVRTGGVSDLPFTGDLYPGVNGLQGSTVYGNTFTVAYDTRDSQATPTQGFLGAAHVEFVDRALGSSTSFTKWGFELRNFTPFRERFVLALHSVLDYLDDGVSAPFYEQNSIGGVNSLRGFGEDRFVDQNRFFNSAELRTRVYQKRVFDVSAELEVAPFLDAGEVFSKGGGIPFSALHVVGGVGFRGIVRPQVVGFVDLGYGSDGPAVFTGLDYPF